LIYLMLLVLISCFRNISPFFLNSTLREYLVYFMYLSMILYWGHSIQTRFTQKSMRIYLLSEAAVAAGWMTIRFIQNAFLSENIAALRYSGYFIFVPIVLVPLLGFYASFGLGHGDDYHLSRKWYLLIIPAAALLVLALNDEQNHFLFLGVSRRNTAESLLSSLYWSLHCYQLEPAADLCKNFVDLSAESHRFSCDSAAVDCTFFRANPAAGFLYAVYALFLLGPVGTR